MNVEWSANWDDDLGGSQEHAARDVMLKGIEDKVKLEFEETFMFYLPRICEHCLNPSCAASCPSGAIYKRAEDGIVLVDQDRCRGWHAASRAARTRRSTSTTRPARPRSAPSATRASRSASRPSARRPVWAGCATSASCSTTPTRSSRPRRSRTSTPCTRRSAGCFLDPRDPEVERAALAAGIRGRLDRGGEEVAGAAADHRLPGRPAAAPGVPHDADGLVHPAAVAGGRRRQGDRRGRGGPGQPVRRDRHAADPGGVPRQPVHRRRRRARRPAC